MKERQSVFLDLDFTLYDTSRLMADLSRDLQAMGYSADVVEMGFRWLNDEGYSLEGHLRFLGHPEDRIQEAANGLRYHLTYGQKNLLPGVFDGLGRLSFDADLALLTYGYPPYQQDKFAGLGETTLFFQGAHYVWKDESKGGVLSQAGRGSRVWFLDDSPSHLEDAFQKAPWVKVVRIAWPRFNPKPDPGDHVWWKVVSSFDEFAALVLRGG
jgi:hypothetical protein